jgi:class 3 adenylate cyclase
VRAGEERKLVTVLFADLVGSTAFAGERDPERVRVRLERFYDAMAEEIERTGGTVEKFAGDAVMAVFGAPAALEDHAERALHAALAMQRRLDGLFEGELQMRVGVNTGEVVVGLPREGSSFVTGDAVNACDRLQKAAEPGEVLAGERTVAAVGGAFELGDARLVEAKGKPGGLSGYPVQRALTLARPRGAAGFGRTFVGREPELDLLLATFRRAVSLGDPHLVTIVGQPGIGKSTLVRELWELLALEDPAPVRRTGRCLPYGDGITYWPLGEIVKEHFGLVENAPRAEVERRLAGQDGLGLALGLPDAENAHPLETRERLQAGVVAFVEELAAERPAVVLVEDIHWAEDDLLDLLERVLREAQGRILLLATARPELPTRRPAWGGSRNTTTVWLEPLAEQATSRMLEELLAIELPDELRGALVDRAEGNPFFVEELVRALVDSGVLERRAESWSLGQIPEDFAVPDTVHATLAARIDRLPPTEKAALQAATVVGRVFWPAPVAHLLEGVEPDFDLLEDRDFIRRRSGSSVPGEREYAVKHALTRDVAYASIPKTRRGRLHASLADWLGGGERTTDEYAALLAYHYSEAVRPEDADLAWADETDELSRLTGEAVFWLTRTARLARGRYELDEAVELYTRAIELAADDRERALLSVELGRVHALRYDGEAFWATMHGAIEGPLTTVERAEAYSVLAFETSVRSGMWVNRPRRSQIGEWVDRAVELAGDDDLARARALLARVNADPLAVSMEAVDEASGLAERVGDVLLRSYALSVRSHAAYERREFAEAAEWTMRRLELVPEIEQPDHLCEIYESSVPVLALLGRLDEAHQLATEHAVVARRLSAHHRVHSASLVIELHDTAADWEALLREEDRVTAAVEANRATPCVRNPRDFLLLALAYSCTGDESRARAFERRATPLVGEGHERSLNPPRLRRALVRGDLAEIRRLASLTPFRTFVWGPSAFGTWIDGLAALRDREAVEREAPPFLVEGTVPEPFALRALGIVRGDDELLARADERFSALGLEWHRTQTERLAEGLSS